MSKGFIKYIVFPFAIIFFVLMGLFANAVAFSSVEKTILMLSSFLIILAGTLFVIASK